MKPFSRFRFMAATIAALTALTALTAIGARPAARLHAPTDGLMIASDDDNDSIAALFELYPELSQYYTPQTLRMALEEHKRSEGDTAQMHYPEFYVSVMARGYDDHVTLRWMPDEYASLKMCSAYGYRILRIMATQNEYRVDTLQNCLRPLSVEEFKARFAATDSLAAGAVQAIHGSTMGLDQTKAIPGTMGSIMEVYEGQQQLYGYAALLADMRGDLARAMALGYDDYSAKPGTDYEYVVQPLIPDSARVKIYTDAVAQVRLGSYEPQKFNVNIVDSIAPPNSVVLKWPKISYSTYDIERRQSGGEWKKLNTRPYIYLQTGAEDEDTEDNMYVDQYLEIGSYEYRISGYDLFGDRSLPSDPHVVKIPDLIPPAAPELVHIEILREDKGINAQLTFTKEIIEEDVVGYMPFYNNPQYLGTSWIPMLKELVPPGDTVCVVNCTGLSSGRICIAAVDATGNVSQSLPMPIDIADMKAPDAPTNLTYKTSLKKGLVRLTWTAPEDDDVMYYQVMFANDSTHMFMQVPNRAATRDTVFIDTLAMDVNQKYIYYKVRAVDYSNNEGEFSEVLRVLRPSKIHPQVAHLDSAWQDNYAIHMRWIASEEAQVAKHLVYRRQDSKKEWELIAVCDADSVKEQNNVIYIKDRPAPSADRWCYAIESISYSNVSSGLSLTYSTKFNGYKNLPCPAKLEATFIKDKGETRLAWEVEGQLPEYERWYWCIYRKGKADKTFKFLLSAKKDESRFSDYLLKAGETAQYYITLMMPSVGESRPSNIVEVHSK